jgi:putative GTP pyrophosphokinase
MGAIEFYKDKQTQFVLKQFIGQVRTFFEENPELNGTDFPVIHSVKARFKDPEHLIDKVKRKSKDGIIITEDNLFKEITDLIGVRVLHLYLDQFKLIHDSIMKQINAGEWCFYEPPKAYTWDPESEVIFNELAIKTERKDSFYTSVHYVIKPNNKENSVCCEIQVRTLFEEIWGEIDHSINYPYPTDSIACKEQIRVLSKLVSTGTRLADSIFRSHQEHEKKRQPTISLR